MQPFTFPSDAAMLAAFESILDQLDTERRTSDLSDRKEQAYWRGQHNAFAKAFAQYRAHVRPDYTGSSYLIGSATRPVVHRVRQAGGVWLCSCEATAFCWHAAMVATVERAIDMLEQGLLGDGDDGDDGSGPIVVTGGAGGLSLSRGDVAIECQAPEQVAEAIGTLLGRRLAAARARLAA